MQKSNELNVICFKLLMEAQNRKGVENTRYWKKITNKFTQINSICLGQDFNGMWVLTYNAMNSVMEDGNLEPM